MGVMRILDHFNMYSLSNINLNEINAENIHENPLGPANTVLCSRGFWVKTKKKLLL